MSNYLSQPAAVGQYSAGELMLLVPAIWSLVVLVPGLRDMTLGTLGATLAGMLVRWHRTRTSSWVEPRLLVPGAVWVALVVLLAVAAAAPGHFGDQAAAYRLVAYPLLALVLPAVWLVSRTTRPLPATATALVTLPFLVDTVGNIWDLYGRISWWDDANHLLNWLWLCGGIGMALVPFVRPRWALVLLVAGLGALLAIAWELGEYRFFYSAPYNARLYRDTLGDESLGTLGALLAGLLVGAVRR